MHGVEAVMAVDVYSFTREVHLPLDYFVTANASNFEADPSDIEQPGTGDPDSAEGLSPDLHHFLLQPKYYNILAYPALQLDVVLQIMVLT